MALMRYRLRTLMSLMAGGPPLLALMASMVRAALDVQSPAIAEGLVDGRWINLVLDWLCLLAIGAVIVIAFACLQADKEACKKE
jgi:hypothetical protein